MAQRLARGHNVRNLTVLMALGFTTTLVTLVATVADPGDFDTPYHVATFVLLLATGAMATIVLRSYVRLVQVEQAKSRELADRSVELDTALDSIADGLVIYDPSTRIRKMNAMAERILGFTADEYARTATIRERARLMSVEREDGSPLPIEEMPAWRATQGEVVTGYPMVVRTSGGRVSHVSVSGAPIRSGSSPQIGAIITFVDVTAQREAAAERERLLGEVESQRNLLQAVIDKAPAGVVVFRGPDFVFDLVNPVYQQFAPGKEMPGRTFREVWPEVADAIEPIFRQVAETGVPFVTEDALFPVQRSFDSPLEDAYWTFSVQRLPSDEHGNVRLLNMAVETTARKRAELELEKLLAAEQDLRVEAQGALKLRDEFLSVAAHELKTPVTTLKGFVQIMIRNLEQGRAAEDAEPLKMLAVIDRQTRKLTRLVEQLLEIARLQNGKLALAPEDADLGVIVRAAIASMHLVRPGRLVRYKVGKDHKDGKDDTGGKDGGPILVHVDPIRIEQVIANLLDNAAKFSPDGRPIEVETSRCRSGHVVVSVRDYGPGVAEDESERIFQRFTQGETAGHRGGLGLGLYISRQIVELHGGTLVCESPEGGGARFVVRLPIGTTAR